MWKHQQNIIQREQHGLWTEGVWVGSGFGLGFRSDGMDGSDGWVWDWSADWTSNLGPTGPREGLGERQAKAGTPAGQGS